MSTKSVGLIYEDQREKVFLKSEGINRAIDILTSKDAGRHRLVVSKRELIEVIEFNDDEVCFDESRIILRERRANIP